MISEAEDYRHLTENALKNISIEGLPYPVRDQKLVLLGEDESFIEEAIRERTYITTDEFSEQFYEIGKTDENGNYILDEDGKQVKTTYHNEKFQRYDRRIRVIKTNYKDFISRIKTLMLHNCFDRKQFENIPQTDTVFLDVNVKYNYNDESEAYRNYSDIVSGILDEISKAHAERKTEIEGENEKYTDAIEVIVKDYEGRIAEENKRFNELPDPYEDYRGKLDNENERHTLENNNIVSDYEKEEITAKERNNLLAKENDLHLKNITAIKREYEETLINNDREHNANIVDLEYRCLQDKNKKKREHEKWLDESTKAFDEKIAAFDDAIVAESEKYPVLYIHLIDYSRTSAYVERQMMFDKALITKSCTDPYFEKFAGHDPSSTLLNRIYGDLEHMTLAKNVSYIVRRCAHKYLSKKYGWENFFNESDIPDKDNDGDGIRNLSYDGGSWTEECDNYEFAMYVGKKRYFKNNDDAYVITKITADAIIEVTGSSTERKNHDEALAALQKKVEDQFYADGLRYEEDWYWNGIGSGNEIIFITTPNENQKNIANSYYAELEKLPPIVHKKHRKVVCQPVTFLPQSIPHESELKQIDSAFEKYLEDVKKENDAQGKRYHELKLEHLEILADIDARYEQAVKSADEILKNAIKDARKSFLDTLSEDAIRINDQCIDVERKIAVLPSGSPIPGGKTSYEIVEEWYDSEDGVYHKELKALNEKSEQAKENYDESVAKAHKDRIEELNNENDRYSDACKEVEDDKEHQKRLDNLLRQHGDSLNSIRESIENETKNIEKSYKDDLSAAYDLWKSEYDKAEEAASPFTKAAWKLADKYDIVIDFDSGYTLTQRTINELSILPDGQEIIELFNKADGVARPIWDAADRQLAADKKLAEKKRYEALRKVYPLYVNNRVRYVASVKPVEGPGAEDDGDSYYSKCTFDGFTNIVFHCEKMNTLTDADFQKYYDEQFPEEEEKETEEAS